jgi:drug/metabolite transporter, DME family
MVFADELVTESQTTVDRPYALVKSHPLLASAMVFTAGIIWSFGAVTARKATATDVWQYMLWRSIGVLVVVEIVPIFRRQRSSPTVRAFTSGWIMMLGNCGLMLASVAFVYAVKNTTAANAAFLSSITPLLAAVLGRFFLKERLTLISILAIVVAFVGLAIMLQSDSTGSTSSSTIGNIAALFSSLGFAGYMVCLRTSATRDWSPIMPGYALMTIALCTVVTLSKHRALFPGTHDVLLALLHGGVFIVVGTFLFNHATKTISAVGMSVLAQSETATIPLWVYLFIGERPTITTIIGGAIMLCAVVGKAIFDKP